MSLPVECQGIQNKIKGARQKLAQLQEELKHAGPHSKPAILAQIRALNHQLALLQMQLTECIAAHHTEPGPAIEGYFIGTSELTTTHSNASGPYPNNDLRFRLLITGDKTVITIVLFPEIKTTFSTPVGDNTTTITLIGGGTGSYAAGAINLPITLHFDQSHFLAGDSDISLNLSTDPPKGSPVTPEPFGNVRLFGSGEFIGGYLGGETGNLKVDGRITAWVAVTVPYCITLFWTEARDAVISAGLVPEFYGPNFAPTSWVAHQSPGGGAIVYPGTTVSMGVSDAEQP
jgi:hypothetical protein